MAVPATISWSAAQAVLSGAYADNFNTASYGNNTAPPATANFTGNWVESGDVTTGNIVTGGQIRITGGDLRLPRR